MDDSRRAQGEGPAEKDAAAAAAEEEKAAAAAAEEEKAVEATAAEEKRQFVGMLEEVGVKPSATWEEAMRLIISNPTYSVLKTLEERKAAFQK